MRIKEKGCISVAGSSLQKVVVVQEQSRREKRL